jgi:hypothetical protein
MDCLFAGPTRRPGTDGKEAQALTHFTLIPVGPCLSAVSFA